MRPDALTHWSLAVGKLKRDYPEMEALIVIDDQGVRISVKRWHAGHYYTNRRWLATAQVETEANDLVLEELARAATMLLLMPSAEMKKLRLVGGTDVASA